MRPLVFLVLFAACSTSSDHAPTVTDSAPAAVAPAQGRQAREEINPRLLRRFKPVRAEFVDGKPASEAQIALGRMLFFDKRLSKDRDLACNSCHLLDKYGVDGQPTSSGTKGQKGHRNSPSVYHAAGEFSNFWDGRASNVEEQAKGPILNPVEMGMASPDKVITTLAGIPGYAAAFQAAFPDDPHPVTYDNLGRAIGAFERKLVTPSRWDAYLSGDHTALTAEEISGFKLFSDIGCVTCHTGELVGGSMFQKAGVVNAWPNQTDKGRYDVTKSDTDEMMFKVPSLRNVAKTAPYFHDGSATTLPEAVKQMAHCQLGEDLGDGDIKLIVTWLGSLTGELPTQYIQAPALPADP